MNQKNKSDDRFEAAGNPDQQEQPSRGDSRQQRSGATAEADPRPARRPTERLVVSASVRPDEP